MKRLDAWPVFLACHAASLSVRATARIVGIHKDTAWRWRHALLAAHAHRADFTLRGRVEYLERPYPDVDKGHRLARAARHQLRPYRRSNAGCVWCAFLQDATGTTLATVAGQARPRFRALLADAGRHLPQAGVLLGRGGRMSAPARLAAACGVPYLRVVAGMAWPNGPDHPAVHASLPAYERRLRRWLRRFRGVATRYLLNYFHWFALLEVPGTCLTWIGDACAGHD